VNISTATDYGMQSLLYLAGLYERDKNGLATTKEIAESQNLPEKYLEAILRKLRQAGVIKSQRGSGGGYKLARLPKDISVADVIRILDGPLASIHGERPEDIKYKSTSKNLATVWIATRVALREVLEEVSLAQILTGNYSAKINKLNSQPGAWTRRTRS